MKQLTTSIIMLLALLMPATTAAYDFEVDGIYYDIYDGSVFVTSEYYESHSYSGDVYIPEKVTYNGTEYTVSGIGQEAFMGCIQLTSVSIPNSVHIIDAWAFMGCSLLKNVDFGNSVTSIEVEAFRGCSRLRTVNLPNSLRTIGNGAFVSCGLSSIELPLVSSIGDIAFAECKNLTSINIPYSVQYIGSDAFLNCGSLSCITVDGYNNWYDSRDNCNAIIETASNTLLRGCGNTVIPSTVTAIGSSAFSSCADLTSIVLPSEVTTIDHYAFSDCTGLTLISIPSGITKIGYYAFNNCNGLTDFYSFCTDPALINMDSPIYWTYSEEFTKCTLHVPTGSSMAYQENPNWGPYFGTIVEMRELGDIDGDGAVSITDITSLIDLLLSPEETPSYLDVNGDGIISIMDITDLIDLLLNNN